MNKPTRGQWKGYGLLCLLLAAILLFAIFKPRMGKEPVPLEHLEFKEAYNLYGDSMQQTFKENKRKHYKKYKKNYQHKDFGYDTSWHEKKKNNYKNQYSDFKIELNSADTTELQKLYGIGPTFARRIVKYRNLLGGYVRKEQLMEVYGMTTERYEAILPHLVLDSNSIKTIDINKASIDELKHHPYLDYYQARSIVNYREQEGKITNKDDLLKINLIDEETVTKIQGYIQY